MFVVDLGQKYRPVGRQLPSSGLLKIKTQSLPSQGQREMWVFDVPLKHKEYVRPDSYQGHPAVRNPKAGKKHSDVGARLTRGLTTRARSDGVIMTDATLHFNLLPWRRSSGLYLKAANWFRWSGLNRETSLCFKDDLVLGVQGTDGDQGMKQKVEIYCTWRLISGDFWFCDN